MKNIKNLRDLEDLPIETLTFRDKHQRRYAYWRKYYRPGFEGRVGDRSIYRFCHDLLQHNIGKSFDLAFSYFCKKAPKYTQHIFLKEFQANYKGITPDYYIDENGNIQETPTTPWRRRTWLVYESPDFKIEWRHKITKSKAENVGGRPWIPWYDKKNKAEDYERVIVSGWTKTFEKRNDPEFKKLRARDHQDAIKKYRKTKRLRNSFREVLDSGVQERIKRGVSQEQRDKWAASAEEHRLRVLKKQEEENLLTIERLGFDPKTSFRGKISGKSYGIHNPPLKIDPRSVSGSVGE